MTTAAGRGAIAARQPWPGRAGLGWRGVRGAGAGWPGAVAARAETVITAHGISTFGDLKYPADFTHLDYVNPDAPKGGEISEWAFGGFDSMNPYSVKGRAGGAVLGHATNRS